MDLARVELLKNEKIFTIPCKMAAERNCSCSCAVSDDRDKPDGKCRCNDNSEPHRGSDFLLDGQNNI